MSEKLPITHPERLKWFRNLNIIGAVALVGVAPYTAPAVQALLYASAAINAAEAGGAEIWRQRKLKKQRNTGELALVA